MIMVCIAMMLVPAGVVYASEPRNVHLTWQRDPRTSITVSWATDGVEPSTVEYGLDGSYGCVAVSEPGLIHHVELSGLEPSMTYHYRCGSEQGWSEDRTFVAAPGDDSASFVFVMLGDSRTNMQAWGEIARATLEIDPAFVLHNGDLVESGESQIQWNNWFAAAEPLLSRKVVMSVLGNHESNAPQFFRQFALPGARQYFSFDYANAHFVALNTEGIMGDEQLEWLERDLASSSATWTFVYFHRPMYSVGPHGSSLGVRDAWAEVLEKYHVDMVFAGHDHIYARTLPIHAGETADSSDAGTIHIVTGGAGAGLHLVEAWGSPWLVAAASEHHFVTLAVEGQTLRMEARLRDQSVLDSLVVNKTLRPDLTISDLAFSPSIPGLHGSANLSVAVWNRGQAPSGDFSVEMLIDGRSLGPAHCESLNPGRRTIIHFEWHTGDEAIYNLTALVDPYDLVDEGILEWNNAKSLGIRVSGPGPDLAPVSIRLRGGELSAGRAAVFEAVIANQGNADSDPFAVGFSAVNLNTSLSCTGLAAGGSTTLTLPQVVLEEGQCTVRVTVDPANALKEIDEANNELTIMIPIRDLIKAGPVYYPRGATEGEMILVKYDDVEGSLPDGTAECALVWGKNGWAPTTTRPHGTVTVTGWAETKMERGLDGLWTIMVPTDETYNWIDLRFRSGQLVGDYFDDNEGSSWAVPLRGWASKVVQELVDAIGLAALAGVDMQSYRTLLAEANQSFFAGDFAHAVEVAINPTREVRRLEAEAIYDVVERAYKEALEDNLTIPRGELMLRVSKESIQHNNFELAKSYLKSLLDAIETASASIPESVPCLGLVACLSAWALSALAHRDGEVIERLAPW